jgi:hypothetical protein
MGSKFQPPLKYIISPTLDMHTGPFSYFCRSGITSRSDLEKAGEIFKVKAVTVQKKNVPPQHEFNLITAMNVDNKQDICFILERTFSLEAHEAEDNSLVEGFLLHDDSLKVLRAVLQASLAAPPDVIATGIATGAALIAGPAGLAPTLGTILLPVAASTLVQSTLVPSSDEPNLPEIADETSHSVTDIVTLSLTAFFDHISQLSTSRQISRSLNKPGPKAPAQDKWLAGVGIETPEYGTGQGARTFEPKNLTLLHLSLLADLVHAEYPLYSLFKNNCFWYSNIFFNCAVVIDSAIVSKSNSDPTDTNQEAMFYLPFHMYLPRVAGRYLGFKVCEVEKIIVGRIVKMFFEQMLELESDVRFLLLRHYRSLIF